MKIWNTHVIRPSKNQNVPSGRPIVLYTLPLLFGADDHIQNVRADHVEACLEEIEERTYPCDECIFQLCLLYTNDNQLNMEDDPYVRCDLYIFLRNTILHDLHIQ